MLSLPHLVILFVVVLVVFGPEKLPDLARNLGKFMAEFRRMTGDFKSTFEGHMRDLERETEERRTAQNPAPAPPPDPALMAPPDAYPYENSIAPPKPLPAPVASDESPKPTRAEGIVPAEAPRLVAREAPAEAGAENPGASSTNTPAAASSAAAEEPAEPVTDGQHRPN